MTARNTFKDHGEKLANKISTYVGKRGKSFLKFSMESDLEKVKAEKEGVTENIELVRLAHELQVILFLLALFNVEVVEYASRD